MTPDKKAVPVLSEKFAEAFRFARTKHDGQARKGTTIPYLSHPMAVASIVLEYCGNEEQAMGALLHDVIEDCHVSPAEITERFGETVCRIVTDCTDAAPKPGEDKPDWRPRKEQYIAHVRRGADPRSLLVSAADKLHNARAIVRDVKDFGPETWKRFKDKEPSDILWYYESLVSAFRDRAVDVSEDFRRLVAAIEVEVKEMRKLAEVKPPAQSKPARLLTPEEIQKNADEYRKNFEKAVTERGFIPPGPDEQDAR